MFFGIIMTSWEMIFLINDHPGQSIAYYSPTILNSKDLLDIECFIKQYFADQNITSLQIYNYYENQRLSLARDYQTKTILGVIGISDELDFLLIRDFKNKLRVLKYLLINLNVEHEFTEEEIKQGDIVYNRL